MKKNILIIALLVISLLNLSAQKYSGHNLFFSMAYTQKKYQSITTFGSDYSFGIKTGKHYSAAIHFISTWRARNLFPNQFNLEKPLFAPVQLGVEQSYQLNIFSKLSTSILLNTSWLWADIRDYKDRSYWVLNDKGTLRGRESIFCLEPGIQLNYHIYDGILPFVGVYYALFPTNPQTLPRTSISSPRFTIGFVGVLGNRR